MLYRCVADSALQFYAQLIVWTSTNLKLKAVQGMCSKCLCNILVIHWAATITLHSTSLKVQVLSATTGSGTPVTHPERRWRMMDCDWDWCLLWLKLHDRAWVPRLSTLAVPSPLLPLFWVCSHIQQVPQNTFAIIGTPKATVNQTKASRHLANL